MIFVSFCNITNFSWNISVQYQVSENVCTWYLTAPLFPIKYAQFNIMFGRGYLCFSWNCCVEMNRTNELLHDARFIVSSVLYLMLQLYCCSYIAAVILLQLYCCSYIVAIILLQLYCCSYIVAVILLQLYCCSYIVKVAVIFYLFHDGDRYQIEPSLLIGSANQ